MNYQNGEIFLNIEAQYEKPVLGFPNTKCTRGDDYHNEFNIIVKNQKANRAVFKFYGSTFDYNKGITRLSDEDIKTALSSILSDGLSGLMSFEEFCAEYGYDEDSRSAEKIHKLCIESMDKLEYLGIEETDMLSMINDLEAEVP
jgi:hypothetical protein